MRADRAHFPLSLVAVVAAAGCVSKAEAPAAQGAGTGASWTAADAMFRRDARWLGGDGAYSVDLGGGRVAWFFGDSFVATTPRNVRAESVMVRNSAAVQSAADPTTATMEMAWRDEGGKPASFFPEKGDRWHWPAGGVRIPGGPLVVFLMIEHATPGRDLGFASDGWRAAFVENPDDRAAAWRVRLVDPPEQAFDASVGTAVATDGDHVFALAAATTRDHAGRLARFPIAALARADLGAIEWWSGSGWAPRASLVAAPAVIMPDAAPEASLHRDPAVGWVHTSSRGFGATTVAIRTAPALTGPWSAQRDVFTPPESSGPRPFVYAAKAHPEIATGDGSLAITYATNSFTFGDLFTEQGARDLYWPRFVKVRIAGR